MRRQCLSRSLYHVGNGIANNISARWHTASLRVFGEVAVRCAWYWYCRKHCARWRGGRIGVSVVGNLCEVRRRLNRVGENSVAGMMDPGFAVPPISSSLGQ